MLGKVVKKILTLLIIVGINSVVYAQFVGELEWAEQSFTFSKEGLMVRGTWTVVEDPLGPKWSKIFLKIEDEDPNNKFVKGVVFISDYKKPPIDPVKEEHRQRFIFNHVGKAYFFGGPYSEYGGDFWPPQEPPEPTAYYTYSPYIGSGEVWAPEEPLVLPLFVEIGVILSTGKEVRGRVLRPQ